MLLYFECTWGNLNSSWLKLLLMHSGGESTVKCEQLLLWGQLLFHYFRDCRVVKVIHIHTSTFTWKVASLLFCIMLHEMHQLSVKVVCSSDERRGGERAERRRVPCRRAHSYCRRARLPAEQPAARQERRTRWGYTVSTYMIVDFRRLCIFYYYCLYWLYWPFHTCWNTTLWVHVLRQVFSPISYFIYLYIYVYYNIRNIL